MINTWHEWVRKLRREVVALFLVSRDPRTPWIAKVLAIGIVAYALSPLDLIPDPIPVLGYLDDLILLPIAIYVVLQLIPPHVLADARSAAADREDMNRPSYGWLGGAFIVLVWITTAAFLILLFIRFIR